MTNKKLIIVLLGIILVASFLRFYKLSHNPPSLTWDEVAWGYNAYSLGIDGRDEFGRFLPLDYIESFGDFKPPMYAYLDILPVKIFGLNEFAVRFPSAFFGILTVVMTYFLVRRLFHPRGVPQAGRQTSQPRLTAAQHHLGGAETLALFSAFFLAISPWHINLSRAAFEANVATFFIVLGFFLFLHAISSRGVASFPPRRWNSIDTSGVSLVVATISFALSMYTFNTARIVTPLIVLVLAIGFRHQLLRMKKRVAVAFLTGIILVVPLFQFLITPQAQLRFHEVNIFSDIGVIERTNQEMENDNNAWWSKIIHNRRFAYSVEYLKHYFDNLNPSFLFIKGDGNPKFSTQDVGSLYLWDFPFFVLGILFLFRQRIAHWWIVPAWMIIAIIPAATARETPHALRIEAALPTFQIFTAYGVFTFISAVSKIPPSLKLWRAGKHLKFFIVFFVFSLLFLNFTYYLDGYYAHYPREYSGEWQYGYKDVISYVKSVEGQYDKVYFTESLGRPYIYFLFYTQYDPKKFRQEALVERETFGFVHVNGFDKYRFVRDVKSNAGSSERVLYVDTPANAPESAQILKNFYLLNGEKTLAAYTL